MAVKIIRNVQPTYGSPFHIMLHDDGTLTFYCSMRGLKLTDYELEFADYVLRTKEGVARNCEFTRNGSVAFHYIDGGYIVSYCRDGISLSFNLPDEDAEFLASYILQRNAADAAKVAQAA